jgi:hypothetical protein
LEDHPEGDAPLVPGDLADPVLADGVSLLLGERQCGERDDLLLRVVELAPGYRVEMFE